MGNCFIKEYSNIVIHKLSFLSSDQNAKESSLSPGSVAFFIRGYLFAHSQIEQNLTKNFWHSSLASRIIEALIVEFWRWLLNLFLIGHSSELVGCFASRRSDFTSVECWFWMLRAWQFAQYVS